VIGALEIWCGSLGKAIRRNQKKEAYKKIMEI